MVFAYGIIVMAYCMLNLVGFFKYEILRKSFFKCVAYLVATMLIMASLLLMSAPEPYDVFMLAGGLLTYSVCAVHNAMIILGKLNPNHHIIRLMVNAVVVIVYIMLI